MLDIPEIFGRKLILRDFLIREALCIQVIDIRRGKVGIAPDHGLIIGFFVCLVQRISICQNKAESGYTQRN
jgi:hypothetical protein